MAAAVVAAATQPPLPVILIYRSRDRFFIVIRGEGWWSLARTEGGSRAKGKRSIDLRTPIELCGIFTSVREPSSIVSSNRPRLAQPEQRCLIYRSDLHSANVVFVARLILHMYVIKMLRFKKCTYYIILREE